MLGTYSPVLYWCVAILKSGFSQRYTIGNINFVFPYICSFKLYLHYMMLENVKLDISGNSRIKFEGCRLNWPSPFLMAQLKRSWQHWLSCIVESFPVLNSHVETAVGIPLYARLQTKHFSSNILHPLLVYVMTDCYYTRFQVGPL